VMRRPRPRIFIGVLLEPLDRPARALDVGRRQATCQHLRTPAIQHRLENAILGAQQPDIDVGQKGRNTPRLDTHPSNCTQKTLI